MSAENADGQHATRLPPCVAAGNPVTAEVGVQVLRDGGSAADAAVAMVLTACVAETVFTGLAGGGYAVYREASTGVTTCLDFFVAVPGLDGRRGAKATEIAIDFGGQLVPYSVGPATVAVPGTPAGIAALHSRWGRLSWGDVIAPALEHAERGVFFTALHSKVLATIAPAMLLGAGRRVYAGDGGQGVLPAGATLFHPGLDNALRVLADEGAEAFYEGRIADEMVRAVGAEGDLTRRDLAAYEVHVGEARTARLGDAVVLARGEDLDDLLGTIEAFDSSLGPQAGRAEGLAAGALGLVRALRAPARRGDTTAAVAVDPAGDICAVTTSLGLASGVWLNDYGLHLNSMLGESELVRGQEEPGARMGSMMSPLVVETVGRLPLLAAGAAGGSRIRSSLLQVLVNVVRQGMTAEDAIVAPRLNPVPGRIHVEPGFPDDVLEQLATEDEVVVWPAIDSYFGGVSAVDRHGPGADPRRGGAVGLLSSGSLPSAG